MRLTDQEKLERTVQPTVPPELREEVLRRATSRIKVRTRLTRRGRIVLWLIYALAAFLLGGLTSTYCWAPGGGIERCDVLGGQMAWVSDAATPLP